MIQKVSSCQPRPTFGNAKSNAVKKVIKAVKPRNLKSGIKLREDIYGNSRINRGFLNSEYRPYGGD